MFKKYCLKGITQGVHLTLVFRVQSFAKCKPVMHNVYIQSKNILWLEWLTIYEASPLKQIFPVISYYRKAQVVFVQV